MTWKCAHPQQQQQQQHAQLLCLSQSLSWSVFWLPLSNPRNGKRSGQQQLVSSALRMTYKCRQKWTAVKDANVAGGNQLELTRLMSSGQQANLLGDYVAILPVGEKGKKWRNREGGVKKAPILFAWLSGCWFEEKEVEIRAPQSENQARVVGRQLCGFAMCRLDNLWPRACTHTHRHTHCVRGMSASETNWHTKDNTQRISSWRNNGNRNF